MNFPLITDPAFYAVAIPAVLLLGITKSGFGAGFGSLAVPMMAMAVTVPQAAAILMPVLLLMDVLGMAAFRRDFDKTLLKFLLPFGLLGTLIGTLLFKVMDSHTVDAMRKLACFRIDYYVENPLIVALLAIENQHKAEYLKNSKEISARAGISLEPLGAILQQGQAQGIFRPGIDVVELHQIMVSMGMFNVSNQHTFGAIFARELCSPEQLARTRKLACEVVLGFLAPVQPA